MGRPVKLPCPISTLATRIVTVLSGLTKIHAVTSGGAGAVAALPAERAVLGVSTSSSIPPPTQAACRMKDRRVIVKDCSMMLSLRDQRFSSVVNGCSDPCVCAAAANVRNRLVYILV